MNKLLSYIKINSPRKQILNSLIAVVIIFVFSRFIFFLNSSNMKKQNWYDLIISIFSNQLVIAYFLFAAFFIFIYNVGSKKRFNQNIFLRFDNKKSWYNYNVIMLLVFATSFILFIIIQSLLEGITTLNFSNVWSEYSILLSSKGFYDQDVFRYTMSSMSPLTYVVINTFYVICYFFVFGNIYLIFSICLKGKVKAFVGVFIVNCLNIFAYSSESFYIRRFSFYHNIIMLGSSNGSLKASMFYYPFIYWIILSISIYIIGRIIISKIDFKFGDTL